MVVEDVAVCVPVVVGGVGGVWVALVWNKKNLGDEEGEGERAGHKCAARPEATMALMGGCAACPEQWGVVPVGVGEVGKGWWGRRFSIAEGRVSRWAEP